VQSFRWARGRWGGQARRSCSHDGLDLSTDGLGQMDAQMDRWIMPCTMRPAFVQQTDRQICRKIDRRTYGRAALAPCDLFSSGWADGWNLSMGTSWTFVCWCAPGTRWHRPKSSIFAGLCDCLSIKERFLAKRGAWTNATRRGACAALLGNAQPSVQVIQSVHLCAQHRRLSAQWWRSYPTPPAGQRRWWS
jgi:hypothetical protein